ncbi:MAG: transposase [Minisyncoccia bacterium]
MRSIRIAPGEHYHICNRGTRKQAIFHAIGDYVRFLFLILYFQSPVVFSNIGRHANWFVKHRVFNINVEDRKEVVYKRRVELVAFCLMPNHFHLLVKEIEDGGIASYMQRVLNSYTKYYNRKYQKSGHLFQGPYRAIHVKTNEQLLYLSTYIHRNPRELAGWKNKEDQYVWSSYQDFIKDNRWDELIQPGIIDEQFKNKDGYQKFVESSTAKSLEGELGTLPF